MTLSPTHFQPPDIEPMRGVYRPLSDSMLLAEAFAEAGPPAPSSVLDLCCGSGFQGIAAAMLGHHVDAVDAERLAVISTRRNALLNKVDLAAYRGDLFGPVRGRTYDAILVNPPYVPTPENGHRAHRWADGGIDGRAVIDRICQGAPAHLSREGALWMVHSSLAGIDESMDQLDRMGMIVEEIADRLEPYGPVTLERLTHLIDRGHVEPGETVERLVVLRATRS